MQISSISVIKKAAMWLVGWNLLKFDIYYSGYIQKHCQKNKKIKRADQILPEVYGTILNRYSVAITTALYYVQW